MNRGNRACIAALALLALVLTTSASTLNTGYLLPGHEFKIDREALKGGRFCALTFDDGPDAKYTMKIAAILSEKNVRATFFLVGRNVAAYPEQAQSLAAAGFEIGNHSWSHPDFTKLSAAKQKEQLEKTGQLLQKLGITARWFRPPYGAFSKTTISSAKDLGLVPMLWSVDPRDWAEPGADTIVSRVGKQTGNGAVILLHSTHSQTVTALPGIIDLLKSRGYQFLTLSEWEQAVRGQGIPSADTTAPKKVPLDMSLPPLPQGLDAVPTEEGELIVDTPLRGDSLEGPAGLPEDSATELTPPAELPARPLSPVPNAVFDSAAEAAGMSQTEGDVSAPLNEGAMLETPAAGRARAAAAWLLSGARQPRKVLIAEEAAPQAPPKPLPAPLEPMRLFSNFSDAGSIRRIWRDSEADPLSDWGAGHANAPQREGRIDSLHGSSSGQLKDTAVESGAELTGLPEGEELVIPPDVPPAAPRQPLPKPGWGEAPKAPKPMDLVVSDLVDESNQRTLWTATDTIDETSFHASAIPGSREPAKAYFLSLDPGLSGYTAVELATYLRLARLSGLVLASDFGCPSPDCELPYAWTSHNYTDLDRGSMLDLTVEGVPEAVEALASGKPNLFVVVRPQNLHFFIAAHTMSEMSSGMRDFVIFRQATEGLVYDTPAEFEKLWQLPAGMHVARFSGPGREAVVLYSGRRQPTEVEVPAELRYMSEMTLDPGGYLRIAQLSGVTVSAGRTPAILYHED